MAKRKSTSRESKPSAPSGHGGKVRLLIRCPHCTQQYDATRRSIGSRFRCHCGREVEVLQPRGHDASVVRCSACGAPREHNAPHCGFCRSDFTIHEQDLNTVCGACGARVSDKACYCHHCGTAITGELLAGRVSSLTCPGCDKPVSLVSRPVTTDGVVALECPQCVGLWLGLRSLHALLDGEPRPGTKASPNHVADQGRRSGGYLPCLECQDLMTRHNFGAQSGIIVDVCGRHGVWFDADELTQLLAWIRSGGLESVRDDLARLDRSTDRVRKRVVESRQRRTLAARAGDPSSARDAQGTPTSSGGFDGNSSDAADVVRGLLQMALETLCRW